MTITEFLDDRITEDEARASSGWARLGDARWETTDYGQDFLTPSAVLAECAAKRAIIGLASKAGALDDAQANNDIGFDDIQDDMLRTLAAVYAGHPDYEPGWKV